MLINKSDKSKEIERARQLAGVNIIKENKNIFEPLETRKGADGLTYCIVKEGKSYYIKTTNNELITESELNYIGGLENKGHGEGKFKRLAAASKALNTIIVSLNEDYGINEKLEKDIQAEEPPIAPGENSAPAEQPVAEPAPQPEPEAPVAPESEPEAPATDIPSEEPIDVPAEEPVSDELDDDSDLEDVEADNIDHYVGKLTASLRELGPDELGESKIKSVLNSIISALPLDNMSPDERLVIAKRIKRGGKKDPSEELDENLSDQQIHLDENHEADLCKNIISSINDSNHEQAKELFGKLGETDKAKLYKLIDGYSGYFTYLESISDGVESPTDVDSVSDEENVVVECDDALFMGIVGKDGFSKTDNGFDYKGTQFAVTEGQNGTYDVVGTKPNGEEQQFILSKDFFGHLQ